MYKNADVDMDTSMWWTMTIPIGKCMPLVEVLILPLTAKATDS